MKKRNFAVRLGIAAMALTLITTSLSSGTLAKYTESFTATGTLKVAKWNVAARVNEKLMVTGGVTLDDMIGAAAASYSGVKSGTIAPGMSGKIQVDLTTAGTTASDTSMTEVDVYYEVYVNVDSAGALPKNLTFKANNGSGSDTNVTLNSDSVEKNEGKGELLSSGTIAQASATTGWTANSVNVTWEWPWETTSGASLRDDLDVTAGKAAGSTTFTFTVVFTQVDPTGSSRHVQGA